MNTTNNHNPYEIFKIKDFSYFLIARLFSTLGVQIQAVVVSWQIYEITKDPLSLGLIGLVEVIPAISVSLYAGHIADRVDRLLIIKVTGLILLFCSIALLALNLDLLPFSSQSTFPYYAIIFISGIARGFVRPALSAIQGQIVEKKYYTISSAWNSTVWQIATVGGPALGGILYGYKGAVLSYTIDSLLMLFFMIVVMLIQPKGIEAHEQEMSIYESITAGVKYVFSHQIILASISLDMFAVLFGGAVALLPIFASEILKTGPEGLGILRAAPSFGAAIMAIYLAYYPPGKNAGKMLLYSVAGFGICMILFGLSTNFYFSVFILALSGLFDDVSVVIRHTIIQAYTPDHIRGRVSAVNSIFIASSNEIGAFESGVTAKLMGTVPSVVLGGFLTMVVVGVTALKAKNLRVMNFHKDIGH